MESRPFKKTRGQHRACYVKVGELLAAWRNQAGLTQRDLAARLGMPQSSIAKIETAHRGLDVLELADWCRACNIDPVKGMATLVKACGL